jgi:hypothetical protein
MTVYQPLLLAVSSNKYLTHYNLLYEKTVPFASLILSAIAYSQRNPAISVIPEPVSIVAGSGSFSLPSDLSIVTGNNASKKDNWFTL